MTIRLALVCLLAWGLAGCSPTWQNVRKQETIKGPGRAYTAVLPEDWKRAPTDSDVLLITRDGLFLQQISITRHSLSDAFAGTTIQVDTPSRDLALLQYKAFRDDEPDLVRFKKDESKGVLGMFPVANAKPLAGTTERVSIQPIKVDGHDAFRLETRSYNSWGLEYTSVAIGFVHEKDYWLVRYLAPQLHYARRDQATFDAFLQNLHLKEKCMVFCSD